MNAILRKSLVVFLGMVGMWMLHLAYLQINEVERLRNQQLAALIGGPEKELVLAEHTQFADCVAQGHLPDPDCTPGDVFKHATKKDICVAGYSSTVRNVSQSLKKKVFAMYGIAYPQPFGAYEIDHLIPLSLGGSNELSNLWPKSAEPFPGFFEKNVTGNYLHREVCAGRVALTVAQEQMARDWFAVYVQLDPDVIELLKQKYPNWADR